MDTAYQSYHLWVEADPFQGLIQQWLISVWNVAWLLNWVIGEAIGGWLRERSC